MKRTRVWFRFAAMWADSRLPWSWQVACRRGFQQMEPEDRWETESMLADRRWQADQFFAQGLKGSWAAAGNEVDYAEYLESIDNE